MKRKITILLGAGFALFVKGLGTKEINNIFANFKDWTVGDDTLYTYIEKILDKDYYDFNFETFLAIIENVCAFRLSQFRDGKCSTSWKNLSSVIYDLKPVLINCTCLKDIETSFDVYRSYINLLNENIGRYDNITKCESEIELFKKYINNIQKDYEFIKIYTTNYDLLVPKALKIRGANIGVTDDIIKQEFIYDIDGFRQSRLTYFPLHGCSYIYQEPYGRFYLCSVVQRMPLYAQSNRGGNPNTETLFTPIISGYSKLEHINGRPFNFGLQAFANDCFDSDLIVTMGYSFRDPHINSVIETFSKCKIECVTLNNMPILPTPLELRVSTNTKGIEDYLTNTVKI